MDPYDALSYKGKGSSYTFRTLYDLEKFDEDIYMFKKKLLNSIKYEEGNIIVWSGYKNGSFN